MLSRTAFLTANLTSISKYMPVLINRSAFNPILSHERKSSDDAPIRMTNPYEREKKVCILCRYKIRPNYKNTRLLAQFQSSFTGKVFGPHVTGLCRKKQAEVEKAVTIAQFIGLMPSYTKELKYMEDPKLYNPDRPFRPHPF